MSRARYLTDAEVKDAAHFRRLGLKWRQVGRLLRRNHSALFKAVRKYESTNH